MYDVHTHFVPEKVFNWIEENQQTINISWEKRDPAKEKFLVVNNKWGFELKESFIDAKLYLRQQEEVGVNHSLVSPIPQLFLYDFPDEITTELAKVYNDALKDWTKAHDDRLSALATVPLNHPEKAAEELKRSMKNGLKGAIVAPMCGDYMIADERFKPFWQAANKLNAIIFIHPLLNEDPRLKKRKMPNLIGVPWETTICATDLILSGILDQYPHIRFLLAHGGGFFPYQIGRLNKGYEMWEDVSENLTMSPKEYLKRFWFDSVLLEPKTIEYLESVVGKNRIVPGSDFPFDLCSWPPSAQNKIGIQSLLYNTT